MMLELNGMLHSCVVYKIIHKIEYLKDCHKKVFALLLNNQTPFKERLTM